MPILKYTIYENLIQNELTKKELNELLEFIYILSLAHLEHNKMSRQTLNFKQEEIEEITINKTAEFLSKNGKQFCLAKLLNKYKTKIKNEVDFNYWMIKIIFSK